MKNMNEIKRLKSSKEGDLLKLKGVTGVGVGEKITKGERTGETCIRVYVKKKLPKSKLTSAQTIPSEINGVPTDVIEKEFVLHYAVKEESLRLKADTGTYDPLTGGISIGPCRSIDGYVYVGTLGLVVEDNDSGNKMMLSNFHVMCVDDGWSAGNDQCQPSRVDGGSCPANTVGSIARASIGGQVDAAVAWIDGRGSNCDIVDIGSVNGTALPVDNEAVRKRGRTTELTYGFVDDISLTVAIDYEDGIGVVTLTNQIGIEVDSSQSTQFGNNGDSGSVVVNQSNEVIGLYFAGTPDGSYGVANPIDAVFSALNIRLCEATGGITTVFEDVATTVFEEFTTVFEDNQTIIETSPWNDFGGGMTFNKQFDDVKNPAGYDTLMETVFEHATIQEHGTLQEGVNWPGNIDPRQVDNPGKQTPFVLSTPHHATAASKFDAPVQQPEVNIEAELEKIGQYLVHLKQLISKK